MSNEFRSVLIGLIGPAVSAAGLLWVVLKPLLQDAPTMNVRYLVFDPAHLLIAAGILISIICLPVAIEVASAAPDEVRILDFAADEADGEAHPPAREEPQRRVTETAR
jgi:hypothetical protein